MDIRLQQVINTNLSQTITLNLNPRMIQMLKLLNLPYTELLDKIKDEADKNALLEVEKDDQLLSYINYLKDSEGSKGTFLNKKEAPSIEAVGAPGKTLAEHLLEQLSLESLSEIELKIGKRLIRAMDRRGYLIDYRTVKREIREELLVRGEKIEKVLETIQEFEPEGVGARDLKESLLIQVRAYGFEDDELKSLIEKVIKERLEELAEKNFDDLSVELGVSVEGLEAVADFIKINLNPNPGQIFEKPTPPIIPSILIEMKEDQDDFSIINLESKYGPSLRINQKYLKMLEDPLTDQETRGWIKQKFETARVLMENILRRQQTIERIMKLMIEVQRFFLKYGKSYLRPFLQKEIAAELDVHPSTISRAIAEKYVQTPQGLFAIKHLCPRAPKGHTPAHAQAVMADMIAKEDKEKPFTDSELKDKLMEMGILLERRTIAAYRKELGIPSSFQRVKKYKN